MQTVYITVNNHKIATLFKSVKATMVRVMASRVRVGVTMVVGRAARVRARG